MIAFEYCTSTGFFTVISSGGLPRYFIKNNIRVGVYTRCFFCCVKLSVIFNRFVYYPKRLTSIFFHRFKMAQPTSEFVQRRFVSQVSKSDALVGKQNWRETAVFHIRGLILSFSFYRFLLIRKIRATYFKIKLLLGVKRFLLIRRKKHLSWRHNNKLRRIWVDYDRNLNWIALDCLSVEFLLTHMFGQEESVFTYDVPLLYNYKQFWKWILLTQGVDMKRLDYMSSTVAKLDNSVYRKLLK